MNIARTYVCECRIKITLRREIVMQENAAKIRVKTGNSGTFTGKIEKNQKIFQIFFKNA